MHPQFEEKCVVKNRRKKGQNFKKSPKLMIASRASQTNCVFNVILGKNGPFSFEKGPLSLKKSTFLRNKVHFFEKRATFLTKRSTFLKKVHF